MLEMNEQQTIEEIQTIKNRLREHPQSVRLNTLAMDCVTHLRMSCNLILPLCTGHFRPESLFTALTELFHANTHAILHVLHACHIPTYPLDIILTWTGALLTAYSIWNEHEIIHRFQERYGSLTRFSDSQRENLFELVSLRAIEMFLTNILENPDYDWRNKLPQKIFLCFFNFHHHDEDRYNIYLYANRWTENIKQVYLTTGAIMARAEQEHFIKPRDEFRYAWQVQQIFSQMNEPTEEQLNLPEYNDFIDDLHRRIYSEVMKPYEHRAKTSYSAGWIFFYSHESLAKIKILQKQLIMAYAVIYSQEFRELPRDVNFTMQLSIINSILYSAINKAARDMPWHVSAPKLALEMHHARRNLSYSLRPLVPQPGEGDLVRIDSIDAKCMWLQMELDEAKRNLEMQTRINATIRVDITALQRQVGRLEEANARFQAFFREHQAEFQAHPEDADVAQEGEVLRPAV